VRKAGRGASPSKRTLRRLALTRPGTRDIPGYLEELCDIPCPDAEGADSPAEVARELWGGERPIVLGAGRDSFKTLVVANVEFLLAHHLGMRIVHFGAFEKQAKQAREYVAATAALPWWAPHARVGQTQASFRSGGWIKFQALTHASARSAHVPLVAFDEADECRPDARRIAVNIASSTAGRTARTIDLSTKNRPSGPMARMIANAHRSGHRVIQYDYKAVTERCPDERSGTGGASAWIHRKYLLFQPTKPAGDLGGWEEVALPGPGCVACPLVPSCRGDLKRSTGVLPIVDLIRIITDPHTTPQDWRSQKENVDPSVEGLVVPEWSEARCVTEDAVYDGMLPNSCAQDFGIEHLAVTVMGQKIPVGHRALKADGTREPPNQVEGRVRIVDEYATRGSFMPSVVDWLASNWWHGKYRWPSHFWIDPSGMPAISRAKVDLPDGTRRTLVLKKADNHWEPGVRQMRFLATPIGAGDRARLEVHPRCEQLIRELGSVKHAQRPDGSYTTSKDRVTGGDDAHDAFRYWAMGAARSGIDSAADVQELIEKLMDGGFE